MQILFNPSISPGLFVVWGVDIVDILLRAPGGFRFLFVGIDTFTKCMEATPVVNIT
jgi:hypothetical protein